MRTLIRLIFTSTLALFMLSASAQDTRTTSGVVVSTNSEFQTITVRDSASGERNTYFVGDSTELRTPTGPLSFSDIKRGQEVELQFRATDTGREVDTFSIGDIDNIVEIIPIAFEDNYTVTGTVTGTRPAQRAIIIRPEGKNSRRTINVPDGVTINRNGQRVGVEDLLKGDTATFVYKETSYGLVLVQEGETVDEAVADDRVIMSDESDSDDMEMSDDSVDNELEDTLPATASNHFAWLLASISLLLMAFGLRIFRRNAS